MGIAHSINIILTKPFNTVNIRILNMSLTWHMHSLQNAQSNFEWVLITFCVLIPSHSNVLHMHILWIKSIKLKKQKKKKKRERYAIVLKVRTTCWIHECLQSKMERFGRFHTDSCLHTLRLGLHKIKKRETTENIKIMTLLLRTKYFKKTLELAKVCTANSKFSSRQIFPTKYLFLFFTWRTNFQKF